MRLVPLVLLLLAPPVLANDPVVRVERFAPAGAALPAQADAIAAAVADELSLARTFRLDDAADARFVVRGTVHASGRIVETRVIVTDATRDRPLPAVVVSGAGDQLATLHREVAGGVRWTIERALRRDGEASTAPPPQDVRLQPRPFPARAEPAFTPSWLNPPASTDPAAARSAHRRIYGPPPMGPTFIHHTGWLWFPGCFFRGW